MCYYICMTITSCPIKDQINTSQYLGRSSSFLKFSTRKAVIPHSSRLSTLNNIPDKNEPSFMLAHKQRQPSSVIKRFEQLRSPCLSLNSVKGVLPAPATLAEVPEIRTSIRTSSSFFHENSYIIISVLQGEKYSNPSNLLWGTYFSPGAGDEFW